MAAVLLHISDNDDIISLPPTCAHVEVHGLLLLPPLDAGVLLLQGVDVGVHPLHHHAVDGCLVLRLGSSSRPRGSHRPGAQLGDVALLRSLLCGAGGRKSVNRVSYRTNQQHVYVPQRLKSRALEKEGSAPQITSPPTT